MASSKTGAAAQDREGATDIVRQTQGVRALIVRSLSLAAIFCSSGSATVSYIVQGAPSAMQPIQAALRSYRGFIGGFGGGVRGRCRATSQYDRGLLSTSVRPL